MALEANMATTLDVMAWEIELAGARCIFLDKVIGETMKSLPVEQQGMMIEGLHAIDLLSQHLTNLSAFARTLSGDSPETAVAPVGRAIGDITLGALADRMATAFGAEEVAAEVDAGDVDLF
ncbi:MAG: hypothetical protein Q8J89_09195 [Caulobacter sp.]|nr:hypothetical protein [Caulobacter sp.]